MILLFAVAHAECTFHATTSDLDRALSSAEAAYASLDQVAFERAQTELDFVLPCLVEPVSVDLAARYHRLRGLGRFAEGDPDGARDSLLGARVLEPDYVFSEDVLPKGYELRTMYEALPAEDDAHVRLPHPTTGRLVLDGAESRDWPADRGVLFQRLDGSGAAVETAWLHPADPTPRYPGVAKRRTVLLSTAAGTAVGAGALYALAWSSGSTLSDPAPSWTNADLRVIQVRTNSLAGASTALGGAAVIQGVLALAWKTR